MSKFLLWLLLAVSFNMTACSWTSLAYNALTYSTTRAGEAGNVVIKGSFAYVTLAEQGLEIINLATGKSIRRLPPPPGSESADDVALADGFLFILDARTPGHLTVFSLKDPSSPRLVSGPIEAPVEPFSGLSAGGGRVIVSGGTSLLTLRTYDRAGNLSQKFSTIDLGRGQPDVLLAPDGKRAFVSAHYVGPRFGLVTLKIDSPAGLTKSGALELKGAGFTAGGAKPANFPIETALQGNLLLLAHSRGLAFINVEKIEEPKLLNILKLEMKPVNVDVMDGIAAVVGSSPKPTLVLVDARNPNAPSVMRAIPLPPGSLATGVAIGRSHVVVAAHKKGALIFKR